jgi:hypothetical protein
MSTLKLFAPVPSDSDVEELPTRRTGTRRMRLDEAHGAPSLDAPQAAAPRPHVLVLRSEDEELGDGESHVISWRTVVDRPGPLSLMELLTRSRVLYRNRVCRECRRPTVEPVDAGDGIPGKNRMPIPGTSTLQGFRCQYCRKQWSAGE